MDSPLVAIRHLNKQYHLGKKTLTALNDISLSIDQGSTLGLVGESGSGKSTLGKCLLRLVDPTSGSIFFNGKDITTLSRNELRPFRRKMQMIFQDPYSSLNPRMNVESIIGEGLEIFGDHPRSFKKEKIERLLIQVGLDASMLTRYPHEFSGGQRQRIGIARSLALDPQFIVCDEPISSLDPITQEQILQLLQKLKRECHLTYLLISHDLTAVRSLSDRVAVMYMGRIVEEASTEDLFSNPLHPYTEALLAATPVPDPKIEKNRSKVILQGEIPSPFNIIKGCPFYSRCPKALPFCQTEPPPQLEVCSSHVVSCHLSKPTCP